MLITQAQRQSFEQAVNSPENTQKNGHINWNFIDADFYMAQKPLNDAEHYAVFNRLAEEFEDLHGIQEQETQYVY
jgi:hypothetical protein